MTVRVLHYSDVENAYDTPERVGRLAGTLDARRDDRTVVVGTGDDTAPGVLAMQTEGRQALDFFRAVEPDLETFGNHDFDFGPGPIREIVAESPQRWLTANVCENPDADRRFADADPTAVVERGGERVGFVGVTDPKTREISAGATDLGVTGPVEAVADHLPDLRERADHVVVLAHLREADEREIAALDGVDAILGGHVHSERRERVDGTLLLRPGANGRVVWEVELGASGDSVGALADGIAGGSGGIAESADGATATRLEVDDGPLHETVADALRERMEATGLAEVVATVDEPIVRERDRRYAGECRVANLVTDAYLWATDADVSFTQNGGLRDGSPLADEVTVADLIGVSPFGGELRTAVLSGSELRELVSRVFWPDRTDGRLWWGHFGGLSITYDEREGCVREIRHDGDRLDLDAEYTVVTNAYVVEHEEGPITPDRVVDEGRAQYEAIVDYAREVGLDVRLDGRLRSL